MSTNTYLPEDDRVAAAVAEYLEALDSRQALSPAEWLACHPDIAADLHDFINDGDGLVAGLRAFRGEAREPDLTTDERRLSDYELVAKVGGNMGVVYRARQQTLPREVAVKILLRAGDAACTQFRAEAEAMARLEHPHVIHILEVGRGNGLPFFSMEWCPGGTLAARVAHYRRRPDDAAELMEKVARAIDFAHRRGLLHRDLKPANILYDERGEPRVADFGLAVPIAGTDNENRAGAGTPAYMAPEQLRGDVTVATSITTTMWWCCPVRRSNRASTTSQPTTRGASTTPPRRQMQPSPSPTRSTH